MIHMGCAQAALSAVKEYKRGSLTIDELRAIQQQVESRLFASAPACHTRRCRDTGCFFDHFQVDKLTARAGALLDRVRPAEDTTPVLRLPGAADHGSALLVPFGGFRLAAEERDTER